MQEQSLGELLNTIFSPGDCGRPTSRPETPGSPDLNDIREMLETKLRWYGWRSVEIGPFELLGDRILVGLIENGSFQSRLSVDRRTGAVRLAKGGVVQIALGRPRALKSIRKPPGTQFQKALASPPDTPRRG